MNVRYIASTWTTTDGIIMPVFKTKRVMTTSTRRFNNNIYRTAKLSPATRNLLDYIIQEMDKYNRISNNALFRSNFLHLINSDCNVNLKEDTVNKGFQELKKAGLLVTMNKKRGVYTVNPIFYFNGPPLKRKHIIEKMLNGIREPYIGCNLKTIMGW